MNLIKYTIYLLLIYVIIFYGFKDLIDIFGTIVVSQVSMTLSLVLSMLYYIITLLEGIHDKMNNEK